MNSLVQYDLPTWIEILFLISITLPFILIVSFVKKHGSSYKTVAIFFILYIAYIYLSYSLGWFNKVSLPPRVLLLSTFPYAFFLFGYVPRTQLYKSIVDKTKAEDWIRLHIFRVVGIFFILLALHNALPKPFAFIAGFGDIITALTSIFVANQLTNKKGNAKKLAFAWNVFGTIDIMFTAIAANVITKFSIDNGSMGVDALAAWPYCIIPAFAPPTILFLHWTIHKKLNLD